MASIINAQGSPLTAVIIEADNTGNLDIQTANTTAIAISSSQVVSLTNPLAVTSGGTGATSLSGITVGTATNIAGGAANRIPFQTGANTTSFVAAPTVSNTALLWNGSAFTWGTAGDTANLTGGVISGNYTVNNASSPNTFYLQFGDNSGWTYRFMTSVGGTPTVRFSFVDNGNFTAVGNVTAFSDERLKKDWGGIGPNFVERLASVKSGTYTRTDTGERQVGVSAQDMKKILPESVQDGEHLSLAYGNAALVAAVELAKQVVELKKEIELLKAK